MRFPSRAGLREILHLALPIIASMASATVMSFIDTWMVALVGTTEVAAVMPAGIIAYTLTALPLGIAQCVSTFTAQALGLTGAALAFVLSYAVQVTVLFWAFLSDVVHQQFSTRTAWQWAWPRFRQLVHIGWPVGMQSAVDVLGWGVLIVLMVGRFG